LTIILATVKSDSFSSNGRVAAVVVCLIFQMLALAWYVLSYIPFGRDMVKKCIGCWSDVHTLCVADGVSRHSQGVLTAIKPRVISAIHSVTFAAQSVTGAQQRYFLQFFWLLTILVCAKHSFWPCELIFHDHLIKVAFDLQSPKSLMQTFQPCSSHFIKSASFRRLNSCIVSHFELEGWRRHRRPFQTNPTFTQWAEEPDEHMRRCAANYAYQVHVPKAGGKEDISGRQTATGTPEDAMAHAHFNFFRIPDRGSITSAAA
jgi:hypothetical protein